MKFTPLFLFALIFITSMSLVASAPPVIQQQFTEGFNLKYPSDQIIKVGHPYEFEVHVFNISNGMPVTTGVDCYFHLYNSTGKHQLELTDSTPSHIFDYSFNVLGGNFSVVGDYYYIVQCNSTSLGGFVEVPFEVTPNGKDKPEGITIVIFSLIFIAIICFGVIYFLKSLAHTIQLEMDLIDTAIMICTYLALFLFYYISFEYLGNTVINDLLETAISVGAITHVFLPLVAFILSFIMTNIQYKQKAKYTY